MITHPAGEFYAFLLELIQESFNSFSLLRNVGSRHMPCVGVCIYQPQLLQSGGDFSVFDNAGNGLELCLAFLGKQTQSGTAAMSGNYGVGAGLIRPHSYRLLKAAKLDVRRKIFDAVKAVKVTGIGLDERNIYVFYLLSAIGGIQRVGCFTKHT